MLSVTTNRRKFPESPRFLSLLMLVLLTGLLASACSGAATGVAMARVQDAEGAVEWSNGDDDWRKVEDEQSLGDGARLRTDGGGSVWIVFSDGSKAFVAPQSELLIESDGVGETAAERAIRLRHERGDSRHMVNGADVEAGEESDLIYVVTTPAGETSTQRGAYLVSVPQESAEAQTRVAVSSGLVKASSGGETYPVAAGRVLTLRENQAPALASFPVYGRGIVSQIGGTWVIGGRQFVTTSSTLIEGDVGVGQLAYVQGHVDENNVLVADLIAAEGTEGELIMWEGASEAALQEQDNDNEAGCFAVSGVVIARDGDVITMHDGQTVDLSGAASVDGDVQVYSTILVVTCISDDGTETYDVYVLEEPVDIDEEEDGKIIICHIPPGNPANAHTLSVGAPALGAHLGHGDYIGFCEGDTEVVDDELDDDLDMDGGKVTICHVPPGNPANAHTITIGRPAVDAHLGHGDYMGACNGGGGQGNGNGKPNRGNNGNGKGRGGNGKP